MYPYHNRIKQRIASDELVDAYLSEEWPRIGQCLVLIFNTAPFFRPVRPHRYPEYTQIPAVRRILDEKGVKSL